jgi:hypothetical protein
MVKIKELQDKPIQPKEGFETPIQLLGYMTEVKSRLKQQITSDFILAKLDNQDKEGILELTGDAYFAQRVHMVLLTEKLWEWDAKKKKWYLRGLNHKEKQSITRNANKLFDAYMTRIHMATVLNRNKDGNYLVDRLTGQQAQQEIIEDDEPTDASLLEKVRKKLEKTEEN